jgi:hypothetical protein
MDKNKSYEELKKDKAGLIHISYSEFSKYSECGFRHLIEKYLAIVPFTTSIHLIFGNAIHSALEMGLKKNFNLEKRSLHFKEQFVKEMMDNLKETEEYKKVDSFVAQGENILRLLSTEKILEKYELVGVEEPLYEVLMEGFYFKGFIDLILKYKNEPRYLIIDWKTSSEPWDVAKKKKDPIFMSQMPFYKYFYGTKFKVPFENIECKYIVLNRLKSKNCPDLGFGTLQPVEIFSTEKQINESLDLIKETVKKIHVENVFLKAKLVGKKKNCFFCPFKNDLTMCNEDPEQYKELLNEHKNKKGLLLGS